MKHYTDRADGKCDECPFIGHANALNTIKGAVNDNSDYDQICVSNADDGNYSLGININQYIRWLRQKVEDLQADISDISSEATREAFLKAAKLCKSEAEFQLKGPCKREAEAIRSEMLRLAEFDKSERVCSKCNHPAKDTDVVCVSCGDFYLKKIEGK